MSESDAGIDRVAGRHIAFGWWLIVVSVLFGTALEGMHAFKLGFYLDVSNETRRLLWTLAHAHGALLGLVNIAFAASLPRLRRLGDRDRRFASTALRAGGLLLPGGFFLGGVFVYEGDPGPAVLLAPIGALLVLAAVVLIALGSRTPTQP
jgi:hypothetical protein